MATDLAFNSLEVTAPYCGCCHLELHHVLGYNQLYGRTRMYTQPYSYGYTGTHNA